MSSFLHSGAIGDIIYGLPIIKRLGGGRLYICSRPNLHPMTPEIIEALKPLLLAQDYITAVEPHKGQKVAYDFTGFRAAYDRRRTLTEAQATHICPQKAADLKSAWLTLPGFETHFRAVVARSARYHNPEWQWIWPQIMAAHKNALFVGLPEEHKAFCAEFGEIEHRRTSTFLEVAQLIAGSPIFFGNQSAPFAIAEGLKHERVQETHPSIRDCIFPGSNVQHIVRKNDWKYLTSNKALLLNLQVHPGDLYQGLELAKLIADIEPSKRDDEFMITYRRDTNIHAIRDFERIVREKFSRVHFHRCRGRATGWPVAPNEMWKEGMDTINDMRKRKMTSAEAVLTFEPDCFPLRPDWVDILKSEWERTKSLGKFCFGHAHNEPKTHINGNAVFATDFHIRYPKVGEAEPRTGWDVAAGTLLLRIGMDSPTIYQIYRVRDMTLDQVMGIRKGDVIPALYHGCKDRSGIDCIRSMMADGSFASRLTNASDSIESPHHEPNIDPEIPIQSSS